MSVKDNFSVAATLSQLRYLVFQGMKGETGKSAYDLAVENGFIGTVVQWIASLKGAPGANGRDGQDGAPGAPGTPGRDGVSPTVQTEAITGGHRVTITDTDGAHTFDVMDGEGGSGGGGAVDSVNGKTGVVVLNASDVGALPADTPIPAAVTEQTVANWGFTKNAVRYDEQMALTDTQKATARTNIGAVGKLEYDALESDIESLEAGLSLKLDAADAPTKVSDLQNDTGFVTAQQAAAAAPLQSVNGRTGTVTVNEVPDASGASVGQVLSKTANGLGWTTPSGGGGAASLIISLYLNSQTGVYTCSASPTQLYNALPNCALAAAEHTIPVSAYKKDGTNYVTAVFVDPAYANEKLSAIVWTLTAATSSSTVTVTREEVAVDGVPDSTSATVGQVLTKTQYGPRWADNNPSSGAALRLLYDGTFGPDDPDLMLMGNILGVDTGNAIATALYSGRIGSAVLVDVSTSSAEVVYDLFAVDYDAQTRAYTVVFARTEGALIRTATLSGSTKTAPDFGTIALGGLPAVTASDNGKFLRVSNGAWAAQAVPTAESNSFGGGS